MDGLKDDFHGLKGVSPPHMLTLVYISLTPVIGIPSAVHKG